MRFHQHITPPDHSHQLPTIEVERTTNHTITTATYTVMQTFTATPILVDPTGILSYDGVNEIVTTQAGLFDIYTYAKFVHHATGIRLAGFVLNNTAGGTAPLANHQARIPATADANEDIVWQPKRPVVLAANDRVSGRVWQNSGGNLVCNYYILGMTMLEAF